MMKGFILFFVFAFQSFFGFTSTLWAEKVQRVHTKEKSEQMVSDSARAIELLQMAKKIIATAPDSSLRYINIADSIIKQNDTFDEFFLKQYADCLKYLGPNFSSASNYSEALSVLTRALEAYQTLDDVLGMSVCRQHLGNVSYYVGNFDSALMHFYKAIEGFSQLGNKVGVADCHNNVGSVLKEMRMYDKSLEYHQLALGYFNELLQDPDTVSLDIIKAGISHTHNNIGIIHWYNDNFDESLEHYQKSLRLKTELGDSRGTAQTYKNIGIVYASVGSFVEAIEYLKRSQNLYEASGNELGMASVEVNISFFNLLLARSESDTIIQNIHLNKALLYGLKAYERAEKISSTVYTVESAMYLSEIFEDLGDYQNGLQYANKVIELQEELFSEDKTKALATMTTRFEVERHQMLVESMQREEEHYKETIVNQRNLIVVSGVAIILLIIFLGVILLYFRQKRKANYALSERNVEILKQKERISLQLTELGNKQRKLEVSKKETEKLYRLALERKE